MARVIHGICLTILAAVVVLGLAWPPVLWLLVVLVPLYAVAIWDTLQGKHAILRNFPLIGHFRYLLEMIRPEIQQYFIERNTDGTPLSRELRSVVYARAKQQVETQPFGTERDVYAAGYEWLNHSMAAVSAPKEEVRIKIGGERCTQPYMSSLLNVSAMSYGSLSAEAVRALNIGAARGGFCHNTGEGGVSPHHLESGGDLCWQIGTGYFGCRASDGSFDPELFAKTASHDSVKMIEVKLSQGAKPGHGGILPKQKITPEIAAIRGVDGTEDVISPPRHSAFDTPRGLLEFVDRLRELSGGKPVGFKLCVGLPTDFLGICKAMQETGLLPDFIAVDGGEGGTGAAPPEFTNSAGAPLTDGLIFVHNSLTGFGLRDSIRVIASGKVITGFNIAARLGAGADLVNSARGFMLALGCIQALRCNTNHCPTGVATSNPKLTRGLVVEDKALRVEQWHRETVHAFYELLGAAGLRHPDDLRPWHIHRRVSTEETKNYAQIYDFIPGDCLLQQPYAKGFRELMRASSADSFAPLGRERSY